MEMEIECWGVKSTSRLFVRLSALCLVVDPAHDRFDDVFLLRCRELATLLDIVPFRETAAAAGCSSMLSHEHGMSAEGRLLSVIAWCSRREALRDEITRMRADYRSSLIVEV